MSTDDDRATEAARVAAFFARAAQAIANDSRVVGSALVAYRMRYAKSEADVAAWLGLDDVTTLHQLALCTKPEPASPSFDDDVAALARYFDGNVAHLRELLSICADA